MSKQHQDFDDLFKMAFEDHQVTPSAHLWDNIERELPPASDDAVFKNAFANFEVEPSPVVWDNVSRKLPISLVLRRHLTMLSRVAAVLLVVMLGTFAFEKWNGLNTSAVEFSTPTAEVQTQNETQSEVSVTSSETVQNDLTPKQTVHATHVQQTTTNIPFEKSNTDNGSVEIVPNTFIRSSNGADAFEGRDVLFKQPKASIQVKDGEKLETKPTMPIAQLDNSDLLEDRNIIGISLQSLPELSSEITVANALSGFMEQLSLEKMAQEAIEAKEDDFFRENAMNYQGYYVSANTQGGYSSIINASLKDQIGTAASPAVRLGGLGGVSIGRKFNSKAAVELGLNFSSQGQRYREIFNGERITKADLTYLQIPLTLKYRNKELSSQTPISRSLVVGLQYGRSIQSPNLTTTLNGEPITAPVVDEALFVTNELGAIAGLDWDFYLTDHVSLSTGFRGTIGTDMSQLFANGSSYNVLFGGRLGVNYRFTK